MDDVAQRIRATLQAPGGGISIIAAVMDTVWHHGTEGTLFKVVKVKVNEYGTVEYIVEPLQHWQVPRPCDESLLGWSSEYRDVACALAAGVGEADASLFKKECELRTHARKKLSADEIELDTENITFNDIKQLIVVPLALRSKKRCGGPSSLAYSRILGTVDAAHSSDGRIASTAAIDGKGLHSRRANIFFSWSFAQRFEDFVDAFDEYIHSPEANIPLQSQQRMYGWVSPLSVDQLAGKKDGPEEWATKFEVLIRAIGGNEKGEEGKGHGTVVVFTPVSPPLCSPASLMSESFEPEPLTRQWCVWELFVTMKTGTRLTVIVPRRYARPREIYVDARGAKCKGVEAQLIRRVIEVQATMEFDARLDFTDVDAFVRDAFESGGGGAVRSNVRSPEIPTHGNADGFGVESRIPLLDPCV